MAQFETWFKCDLQSTPQLQAVLGNTFTQDNLGNLVGAIVTRGGQPVALTGSVIGYAQRADGNTVVITGSKSENKAWIVLPEAAYVVPGRLVIVVRLVDGDSKTVLCACAANVLRTTTDQIVDPGDVVPDLDDLLAQIDAMEQGTAAANTAASAANTAAANANEKAALADQKAAAADTAAAAAIAAKEAAELATDDAQDATDAANTAAQQALLVDNDGLFYVYVEEE